MIDRLREYAGMWLLGVVPTESETGERALLRKDGYLSAIADALEVVATAETRREITEELRALHDEVTAERGKG